MTPAEAAQHPPLCCKKVSPIYTALLNAFLAAGITPHIAWVPKEMRQKIIDVLAENLTDYLNGGTLNRVEQL